SGVIVVVVHSAGAVRVIDPFPTRRSSDLAVGSLPAVTGIISGNNDVVLVTGGTLTLANSINAGTGNIGLQAGGAVTQGAAGSISWEEHTSEVQSRGHLTCRGLDDKIDGAN